ncbi:MAG: hypothetical protein ACYDAD_14510 [Acidimicrobiales bacterium]
MRGRRLTVTLPEPVADALHGEALRTTDVPGRVLVDFLLELFPAWVARRMVQDFGVDGTADVARVGEQGRDNAAAEDTTSREQ